MQEKIKSILSTRNIKLPAQQSAVLFAVVILLIGIITSLFLASLVARQSREDYRLSLEQKQNAIESQLSSAVAGYNQLLIAGATLFNLKGDLTAQEWAQFYEDMQVERQLPSTLGVGYTSVIKKGDISAFEMRMREQGAEGYTVNPITGDDTQTAITYLEPNNEINKRALGFDMYSVEQRREAMNRAIDSASMAVSAPVITRQDQGTAAEAQGRHGVLMYYPVYTSKVLPMTVETRRQQLKGFIYIVVRPSDILERYQTASPQAFDNVDVILADVSGAPRQLAAIAHTRGDKTDRQLTSGDIVVGNRRWAVEVSGRPSAINTTVIPLVLILGGSMLGFVIALTMLRTLLRRLEHVQRSYEHEVERTKDELLALASHQLRTPASGVKQYIGILTSGIVGPLTAAQQQIAEKAYNTNERQIEIINQLLYVSKIEAGKVTLRLVKSDITPVVQRAVDSLQATARLKNIKVIFKTKQPRYVFGDEQYFAMIVDNLISNAIKYSYPNTTVMVRIVRRPDDFLAVSVTDRGVGIPDHDKEHLFQKFRRLNNPLSRSESGSGLGLFLAYQLARAHGGDITVSSQEGKGSTFTLLLPTTLRFNEAQVDIVDRYEPRLPTA